MVFNREVALDRVGGDEELLDELVDLYLAEYPRLLQKIRAAVSTGDAPGLYRSAHSLKGSLGALAAEDALEHVLELETRGRATQLEDTASILIKLENCLTQLHNQLTP
jgi:two-component system, sensor histidine kinase and response regulator